MILEDTLIFGNPEIIKLKKVCDLKNGDLFYMIKQKINDDGDYYDDYTLCVFNRIIHVICDAYNYGENRDIKIPQKTMVYHIEFVLPKTPITYIDICNSPSNLTFKDVNNLEHFFIENNQNERFNNYMLHIKIKSSDYEYICWDYINYSLRYVTPETVVYKNIT